MKKTFKYEFEDESQNSTISYEIDGNVAEKLVVEIESGTPILYGNKQAFLLLAKIFSKLSLSDYENGFHIHLNVDLDTDNFETLRIVLDDH